ncbi:MAG TPA: hypothetical protein VHG08_28375 [Longimicrobium sp.]|nr:hypothetical protein [Longimicrobium sp.]
MRNKLKLDLDQLAVDSFDTEARATPKGTVFGEQCTCYTNCTCPGCPTCDASCNGTCGENTCQASCNGTCGDTCNCSGYTCDYCTINDYTCNGYGTCGVYPCREVP